jgi:Tfp pilus assembly protein PilW
LVEALLVCLMMAVVLGAVFRPLITSERAQIRNANYSYAQEQARAGLDSMVSQIRQATAILSDTPNSLDMNVSLRGVLLQVYYECDIPQPGSTTYWECVRLQTSQGSTLPALSSASVVIRNLPKNGTVFTFYPNSVAPYYMTATINVPASGGLANGLSSHIVFSDGALMRNLNVDN